jgi:hypothetical protein
MADFPNVVVVMAVPAESAGVFEAAGGSPASNT